MKKNLIIIFAVLTAIFLSGCALGKTEQKLLEETTHIVSEEVVEGPYYAIREVQIPEMEVVFEAEEGQKVMIGNNMMLAGGNVYARAYLINNEYEIIKSTAQIWTPGTETWTICKEEPYFLSSFIYTTGEQMYGSVHGVLEDGETNVDYIAKIHPQGEAEVVCERSDEFEEALFESSNVLSVVDRRGNFYFFSSDKHVVTVYDGSTKKINTTTMPHYVNGMMQSPDGKDVLWYGYDAKGKSIVGNLSTGQVILENFDEMDREYRATVDENGVIYLADCLSIWKIEDGMQEKLVDFRERDYRFLEVFGFEKDASGALVMLVELDNCKTLLYIEEAEKPAPKKEIEIAFARRHWALERSIARFNRQSEEYHITVFYPEEGEEESVFRQRIQMEITNGQGPDILGSSMVHSAQDWADNGFLECVDDVYAKRSGYVAAAVEDGKVNGKLYGVPFECTYEFVSYPRKWVDERKSITVLELMELVKVSDAEILQEGVSGVGIVYHYGLRDQSNWTYIDWKNGESHLTEPEFLELLEFAKEYADTDELDKIAFAAQSDIVIEDMRSLVDYLAPYEDEMVVLGYPREEGNGIYISSYSLYLNANSEYKEGAKEFFAFILSDEEQAKNALYDMTEEFMYMEGNTSLYGALNKFPIAVSAYEILVNKQKESNYDKVIYTDQGRIQVGNYFTEEMENQLYFMVEHARCEEDGSDELYTMVYDELNPYFTGDITAKEAAEKLDNRVQLYLDERK